MIALVAGMLVLLGVLAWVLAPVFRPPDVSVRPTPDGESRSGSE